MLCHTSWAHVASRYPECIAQHPWKRPTVHKIKYGPRIRERQQSPARLPELQEYLDPLQATWCDAAADAQVMMYNTYRDGMDVTVKHLLPDKLAQFVLQKASDAQQAAKAITQAAEVLLATRSFPPSREICSRLACMGLPGCQIVWLHDRQP